MGICAPLTVTAGTRDTREGSGGAGPGAEPVRGGTRGGRSGGAGPGRAGYGSERYSRSTMNRFKASKFRHTEARLPRREVSAAGPAGTGGSRGRRGRGCRRAGTGTGRGAGQGRPRPAAPAGCGSGPRGIAGAAGPCPGLPAAVRVRCPGGPSLAPGAAHPGVGGGSRPGALRRWGCGGTPTLSWAGAAPLAGMGYPSRGACFPPAAGHGWHTRCIPGPCCLLPFGISPSWSVPAREPRTECETLGLAPATLLCHPAVPPRCATLCHPASAGTGEGLGPMGAPEPHHPGHELWSSALPGPGSSGSLVGSTEPCAAQLWPLLHE